MSIKKIVSRDSKIREIVRHEVARFVQLPATKPPEVPKTLDWYRDTTKWLVATAAATVVLGLGYFGETANTTLKVLFTIAGVLLLVALGAGALEHLWIVEFGKLWENRGNIRGNAEALNKNEREQRKFAGRLTAAYYVLLVAFFAGMAMFAVPCGIRMWQSEPRKSLVVTSNPAADELFLTNPSSGETWKATKSNTGSIVWQQIVPPLPPK